MRTVAEQPIDLGFIGHMDTVAEACSQVRQAQVMRCGQDGQHVSAVVAPQRTDDGRLHAIRSRRLERLDRGRGEDRVRAGLDEGPDAVLRHASFLGWRDQQAEITIGVLTAPHPDLGGRAPYEGVLDERVNRWIRGPRSTTRSALLAS